MRIAIFTDAYHPRVSGLVSSIDEFAHGLEARGHTVLIICPSYPAKRMTGTHDDARVLRVPSGSAVVDPEDRLALPWREAEALRRVEAFKPDVVHIQTEFSIGNLGRRYCRAHGLPVISTCHTHYEMYIGNYVPFMPEWSLRLIVRAGMRKIYNRDDYVIVPSLRIAAVLASYGVKHDFSVIPTGVDDELFRSRAEEAKALRAELTAKYPQLAKGPLLVYVGRLGWEKNLRLLLESFAIVHREFPDACLLMVGDGPARKGLRRLAHELKVGHRMVTTGYVDRDRLPAYYSIADLFAFPSATETQGLVTIEAMLCGTPVVGVDEMGSAEVMAGERGGLLASNDKADFADKVLRMLRDPALRAQKAHDAAEWGKTWTVKASCDKMAALYERALKKG